MRILLIVQPDRVDFYNYLSNMEGVEWNLLWYESKDQMPAVSSLPLQFQNIYFWNQFSTPEKLLNKLKPDRIIFFEIIDLRQIALIVTARSLNIPSFYLEHGAAGDKETAMIRAKEIRFSRHKLPYFIKRLSKALPEIIKSKYFYYSVRKGFRSSSSYWKYFLLPFRMLGSGPNETLSKNIFRERVPDKSIVFNMVNYEEFHFYTGIHITDAVLTGVPFFDKYYRTDLIEKEHVVYIDHPYLEDNIAGWYPEHHRKIAEHLYAFADAKGVELYVKLHPRSNKDLWHSYGLQSKNVHIIQSGDYTDLFLTAKMILGFSSSLINGFLCAKKNVVLLGWHPIPKIFGADFTETGLCHASMHPEELIERFPFWIEHNLSKEDNEAYLNYIRKFNFPFDGKATERVMEAIKLNRSPKVSIVTPIGHEAH